MLQVRAAEMKFFANMYEEPVPLKESLPLL